MSNNLIIGGPRTGKTSLLRKYFLENYDGGPCIIFMREAEGSTLKTCLIGDGLSETDFLHLRTSDMMNFSIPKVIPPIVFLTVSGEFNGELSQSFKDMVVALVKKMPISTEIYLDDAGYWGEDVRLFADCNLTAIYQSMNQLSQIIVEHEKFVDTFQFITFFANNDTKTHELARRCMFKKELPVTADIGHVIRNLPRHCLLLAGPPSQIEL
ncbi:hypothetical protein FO488_00180 [Geobacter sp. FeAm09]|uniref:hypothetical protein n=1 Tax=Geobacter sp. FeAm09 TaxID=2597769 RepID=UPI0011EDDBA7|nr:hypothetical protein [Geobacter sp. FeAm09]QEM66725.1 hypothetical protein FO488_00180 [Geobacter sp. FeAm09]